MTKAKADPPPTPSLLLDAYGNPGLVAPGQLIESSWGNSLVERAVLRFPTIAAMQAASAGDGQMAIALNEAVIFIRLSGTWKPTAIANRIAFRLVGGAPGQSMGTGVLTTAQFAAATDPFGVVAAGIFTVPAGWAGRWMFEYAVQFAVGGMNGLRQAFVSTSPARLAEISDVGQEAGTRLSGAGSVVLGVGQTAQVTMYHSDSSSQLSNNASANNYFQGYYVGPY